MGWNWTQSFSNPSSKKTSMGSSMTGGGSSGGGLSGGIIGGIIGAIGNIIIGALNYTVQKKQYEWQKRAWKQQMSREDNAMQRRMLDLQKAGLSGTLAVGQGGAGASGPPANPAPQMELGITEQAALMVNLLQGQKNISKTQAEIELLQQNTREKRYNTDISQRAGVPTQGNTIFDKYYRSLKNMGNKFNPWSKQNKRVQKKIIKRGYNQASTGRKY